MEPLSAAIVQVFITFITYCVFPFIYEIFDSFFFTEVTTSTSAVTVVISTWFSVGFGWISSEYMSNLYYSTFDIGWANEYEDFLTDDDVDMNRYSAGPVLEWVSSYQTSQVATH